MNNKMMLRGLAVVALAAAIFGGTAKADVILPTQAQLSALGATQYQIAFVTTDTTGGDSGAESTYNNIAVTDAHRSPTLSNLGATWTAITSTFDGATYTDASINAPTYPSIPIFNTHGGLVLADGASLYREPSAKGPFGTISYDEIGVPLPSSSQPIWTGFFLNRAKYHGYDPRLAALGTNAHAYAAGVAITQPDKFFYDASWKYYSEYHFPVIALSSPLTATVPEPATFTLFGSALLGLGVVYLRRRRAKV